MSYDILAFDPDATTDADFGAWWEQESESDDGRSYDDASVTTPALQAFLAELTQTYPPLNGPGSPSSDELDADEDLLHRATDYSIGRSLVSASFSWSRADAARALFLQLAARHGVAVALVSDGDEIIRPASAKPARHPFWRRKQPRP
ncbi:hypothetical protein EDF46_0943 [Frondihabitans sp. PhB188]|uniref:hypothetical protein n=1 Tax=Frondihabitans sp. PhB188 TaxID=2485200 RepID=UPI000F4A58F0|nr:hypothetical protein [Frondihabitans sp. PhB188]ROQ41562.1 hypothetical protein EDF46_0943 [Frondihabitans sp. PhB188]